MVSRLPAGDGDVLLFTSPISKTDLLNHPIFVPLVLNAALYSRQNPALYTISGKSAGPAFYRPTGDDRPLSLKVENGNEIIPRQRSQGEQTELYDLPPELEPGLYPVMYDEQQAGFVALNPKPDESRWNFLNHEELQSVFAISEQSILMADTAQLEYSIQKKYEGTPLWKWFIAAAILFLILEIALIKLWR